MSEKNGKLAHVKRKAGRPSVPVLDPELVAAALAELHGNVAGVAKRFNVARNAIVSMIEKRPSLKKVVADAREGMLDNGESALYRAVLAGEAWAVCFFLKTQGKPRGYIERQELETNATGQVALVWKVKRADGDAARGGTPPGPT